MVRLLAILSLFLVACQGTLEMEDPGAASPAPVPTAAVSSAPQAPAPTTPTTAPDPPADTVAPTTPGPTTPEEPPLEEEPPVEEEPTPTLPEPGSTVEFTIAQGTGAGPWNTPETAVVVYVGQVLRVTNFDDRDHQIHASSAAPIPHGNRIVPGQSEEYVVTSPLTVGTEAQLWDHGDGRNAPFWVEAREYPTP